MVKRYKRPNTASMAEFVVDYLEQRDEDVMQAVLAAGMFVAYADGRVERIERDELLDFIDRQGFAPRSSRDDISEGERLPRAYSRLRLDWIASGTRNNPLRRKTAFVGWV